MPAKNLDALISDLASSSGPVRARATKRLIALGDRRAVAPLIPLLEHTSSHVRCRAAEVLGELGDSSAFEPLAALLADSDHDVHSCVIAAFGALGDLRAVPLLVAELEREEQGLQRWIGPDGTTHVYTAKFAAAPALARLGADEAIPALLAMLNSKHMQMRLEAVRALGIVDSEAIFDQLMPMLADGEGSVASVTAATLYAIDPKRAVAALRVAIEDERPGVRRAASELLTRIGDSKAATAEMMGRSAGERANKPAAEPTSDEAETASLDELAQALQDERPALRLNAVGELGSHGGSRAAELLRAATSDPNYQVRTAARLMLAQLRPAQSAGMAMAGLEETLARLNMLTGGGVQVRFEVGRGQGIDAPAIGDATERVLVDLRRELHSKDMQTRIAAATSLGHLGRQETLDALTESLDDAEAQVRRVIVQALGKVGSDVAIERLVSHFQREADGLVRTEIIAALDQAQGDAVRNVRLAALRDREPAVRLAAARQLANHGDEQAISVLSELVQQSADAAQALAGLGDDGMRALTTMLTTGDAIQRTRAAMVLGKVNRPEAVGALKQALADESEGVRRQAAYALAELKDAAALPMLIADLHNQHPELREFAASYLGVLGMAEANAPLIAALSDDSPNVRATAAGALGEIGSSEALPHFTAIRRDDAVTSWGDEVRESVREAIRRIKVNTKRRR